MRMAAVKRLGVSLAVMALGLGAIAIAQDPKAPAGQDPKEAAVKKPSAKELKDAAARTLSGLVVDAKGQPIEGASVLLSPLLMTTNSGADGSFRFENLDEKKSYAVLAQKGGFASREVPEGKPGKPGLKVELRDDTVITGKVVGTDGKPAADALIRARQFPRLSQQPPSGETVAEARTGSDGAFRLLVAPGDHELICRVPGLGVTRVKTTVAAAESKTLDLKLEPGVTLRAFCVDKITEEPIRAVTLTHWQWPDVQGVSDLDGWLVIRDLPPGEKTARFAVDAKWYSRWWVARVEEPTPTAATKKSPSAKAAAAQPKFRRDFDLLDIDIADGMPNPTIEFERGVVLWGKVVDPDGNPVGGATVKPVMAGQNPLAGDPRFLSSTNVLGEFELLLPAGGTVPYNLLAHDGAPGEWRNWADAVTPPMTTEIGQVTTNLVIKLNPPATVSGKVLSDQGTPVAGRLVRARGVTASDDQSHDRTATTGEDGSFDLLLLGPGEHTIQVAPFWLPANQAPTRTTKKVKIEPGEVKRGVDLVAEPEPEG